MNGIALPGLYKESSRESLKAPRYVQGAASILAFSKYTLLTDPLTVSHSLSLASQGLPQGPGQYADKVGMTFSLEKRAKSAP